MGDGWPHRALETAEQSSVEREGGSQSLNMWSPAWNVTDICGKRAQPEIFKDVVSILACEFSAQGGGVRKGRELSKNSGH